VAVERELAGVVGEDDGVGQQAMRLDAAPQRPFGGDPDRIGGDGQRDNTEPVEMVQPSRLVHEMPLGMRGQPRDHGTRQRPLTHIG